LSEAAKIGYTPIVWPRQYVAGKGQMESIFQREKAQAAAVSPVRAAEA
jgi:anthraniloyl-CoA monooxygenase